MYEDPAVAAWPGELDYSVETTSCSHSIWLSSSVWSHSKFSNFDTFLVFLGWMDSKLYDFQELRTN